MASPSEKKTIVFFHPDLGIGGAERLVIDAAVGLQARGHRVVIYTSHCDPAHCFDEARDGTLNVRVRGNSIFPATLLGRFKILLTILRHIHLLLYITFTGELRRLQPTVFFIDQLSAGIPLLRYLFPDIRILFYCHFPDLLLVQGRKSLLKRLWRWGFDAIEGWGMRGADRTIVNSEYTKGVVDGVWRGLGGEDGIGVVYPCVDVENTIKSIEAEKQSDETSRSDSKKIVLSINRFERKKDIGLAIRAYAALDRKIRERSKLVVAGGYDNRVQENVAYHNELVSLADKLGLKSITAKNMITALGISVSSDVVFLQSVPARLKAMLLSQAKLLVYTPSNEHFGIVPLEAMLAGIPVLAANTGGPLETIVDGETGWLRDVSKVEQWTEIMQLALAGEADAQLTAMGEAGKRRVKAEFSATKMAARLDEEIDGMLGRNRASVVELQDVLLSFGITGMLVVFLYGFLVRLGF